MTTYRRTYNGGCHEIDDDGCIVDYHSPQEELEYRLEGLKAMQSRALIKKLQGECNHDDER